MLNQSVIAIWERIDDILASRCPDIAHSLRGPASSESIDSFERQLPYPLPRDMKTSLLLHDGQREGAGPIVQYHRFCSVDELIKNWLFWRDLHPTESDLPEMHPSHRLPRMRAVHSWEPTFVSFMRESGACGHIMIELPEDPESDDYPVFMFENYLWQELPVLGISGLLSKMLERLDESESFDECQGISITG